MTGRPRIDVVVLITGMMLLGVAVLAWLAATTVGMSAVANLWFAGVLLATGLVGLVLSLRRNR